MSFLSVKYGNQSIECYYLEEYTIACNVLLFFTQHFSCIITHRRTLFSNLEFLAQFYEAAMIQISFENSQYKVGQRNLVSKLGFQEENHNCAMNVNFLYPKAIRKVYFSCYDDKRVRLSLNISTPTKTLGFQSS